jgi:RNA polymerase sigma-70 factor (ECF subfamily)
MWRAGNEEAARKLFERYTDRLIALARGHIDQRLARRVDPEDITQSVFRTFFRRARGGEFSFQDPDGVYRLLARITVNKTLDQVNFHRAAKRNFQREADARKEDSEAQEVLGREPPPDVVHTFVDQLEHFLARLNEQERQVLQMRMDGYSAEEIAGRLQTYDRKIYRILERIRGLAEQEQLSR